MKKNFMTSSEHSKQNISVAFIAAASGAYLLCFYALGLLISSLTKSQKMSLVVLLVIWVIVISAIPPTATFVAQATSPVQSSHTVQLQNMLGVERKYFF